MNWPWPPKRDSKADVSSDTLSSERIEELWVVFGLYIEIEMELRNWLVRGNVKKKNRIN